MTATDQRTMYWHARPEEGISDEAITGLAELLHDTAVGCEVHYPPRTFCVAEVHQHDALVLLRAIRRSVGPLRLTPETPA